MTAKTPKAKPAGETAPKAERKPRARREPTVRILDLAKATNLALAGATYKQIASELEVDEETVRYHLLSAEGQKALRYAVNDLQERSDRFLASAHLQALRRLVREMEEAEKPGDRIRAAQAITMLAAKRIEVTGANGSPIEVDTTMAMLLDERISRMRERSRGVIDTTAVVSLPEPTADPIVAEVIPVVPEPAPIPEPVLEIVTPAASPQPAAGRTRQPAGLAPGQGLRARR
jgi:hypothetical protein